MSSFLYLSEESDVGFLFSGSSDKLEARVLTQCWGAESFGGNSGKKTFASDTEVARDVSEGC